MQISAYGHRSQQWAPNVKLLIEHLYVAVVIESE
jgi:hypothetical protein